MQLIRTTIRLKSQLKKFAEHKALEESSTLQEIVNTALEKYLEQEGEKEAKQIVFKTHRLGEPLDNLTRDNFYHDPK